MTTLFSLPLRPSWESIRKQAKKLARDIAAGDAAAVARARSQLPPAVVPSSLRDAQLVLAREYGFSGWKELKAEVLERTGRGLEWAVAQALRAIHDDDVEQLQQLVSAHPASLTWRDEAGSSLLLATTSFVNFNADAQSERIHNRPACASALIDAGAVVEPRVWERVIETRAEGMLGLLWSRGVLPRTLPVLAAVGDLEAVRAYFNASDPTPATPEASLDALLTACRFEHGAVALFLLERCIALDGELGQRIAAWGSRAAFIEFLSGHPVEGAGATPWATFVAEQLRRAMDEADLSAFERWLKSEPVLLSEAGLNLQVELLQRAAYSDREPFIAALFALDPAVLRVPEVPPSLAVSHALEYGNAHLVPLLTRVWPLPDDLPHAAGTGDLARVERWFDAAGRAALGVLDHHYPANNPQRRMDLLWGASNAQQVLDTALAWACMNRRFDVASFLLEHGANIDTNWATHEPASILHECVRYDKLEAAEYLVSRGIDMTIVDHRYEATAEGWAHFYGNERLAKFLAAAESQRRGDRG